jgi:K+-sensing histidine kinase KdpD
MNRATRQHSPDERVGNIALALGPGAAVVIAGALAGLRGELGATNVALVLTCVVVVAAVAGRAAGFATGVVAAVSFNFFHTQPYESLRIADGRDVATVIMLVGIGIVVSEVSHRRREAGRTTRARVRDEHSLEATASRIAHGASSDEVWSEVRSSITTILGLSACRFEAGDTTLPVIERSGSLVARQMRWDRDGFVLAGATAIPVAYGERTFGHLVLVPGEHSASTLETRRAVLALADLLAVSFALDPVRTAEVELLSD